VAYVESRAARHAAEHGGDARGGNGRIRQKPLHVVDPSLTVRSNIFRSGPSRGLAVSRLAEVVKPASGCEGREAVALNAGGAQDPDVDRHQRAGYGTSQSASPSCAAAAHPAAGLDETLKEVATRRGIALPTTFYVRSTTGAQPDLGSAAGQGEFASPEDPTRRILACFLGRAGALSQRNDVYYRQVMQASEGVR
jgi:hypothetical protein